MHLNQKAPIMRPKSVKTFLIHGEERRGGITMELEFVRRIEINNSSYTRKKIDDGQFWAVLPCFP
jgi:hypothetical protein